MEPIKILVVDDNRSSADALGKLIGRQGHDVRAIYSGQEALGLIEAWHPDVVLTDLKMEPVDGMQVLSAARALRPPAEVIVFTAYGAIDVAVEAMRRGAKDFLTKPVAAEQLLGRLGAIAKSIQAEEPEASPPPGFVADSASSKRLVNLLRRAAAVPSPVWFEGEIGSGREHAAWTLHALSANDGAQEPFVTRDLASDAPWPTRGTVLLPGVDDLADDLQRRLSFSLKQVPPEVRLVATAGPDARRKLQDGTLRQDLYYALAVIVIPVPPLRERGDDVQPLFQSALEEFARRYGRPVPPIEAHHWKQLRGHLWPGNVRELRNLAERTVVMGTEFFEDAVPPAPSTHEATLFGPGFSLNDYLEEIERQVLTDALALAQGDRNEAGRILGVERNTLRYKLNKYGLLEK